MPAAEVDVTAALVSALIASQHPDLAGLPVEFLANGWDNAIFRLGDSLLARMPRREFGARTIAHEQRWLPLLAPRLPVKVPAPLRVGRPAPGFPYSWSVVPYLPGTPAADAEPGELDLSVVAAQVGGFLSAMHRPAPPDAPENPFRGIPLGGRADTFEENLALLSGQADGATIAGARRLWADALAAPAYDGPPRWLHGDLHPANILAEHRRVSAIIDFGDITAGDPASDLSVAWMLLPLEWHAAFRAAYGNTGEDLWRRARGWALALGTAFVAHSADNPQIHRIGLRALRAALAGLRLGARGPGQGASRCGPRNRNVASRIDSRPSSAMSRRPSPRPRPPCGGQPNRKQSR
jgi:aminoglycoside phosphotransferase (APT) family kinase protein